MLTDARLPTAHAAAAVESHLAGYPRTFWVVNVMELFERAAYHGMNAILAVYLTRSVAGGGLGFSEQSVGLLQSLIYATAYVVPIVGGALADRYGYRRTLLVAFSLLAAGYFIAGQVSAYSLVFLSLLVMATGSGLFKPLVTGTIARVTDASNSAIAFGVYYWMVNLGVFLGPLFVTVIKGFAWRYVFVASALYTGLMLLPTLTWFNEPPRPASRQRLAHVLVGTVEVLSDSRFMLMVVIYSTFSIMHFQHLGSLLWYLRDFVDGEPVNRTITSFLTSLGLPWRFVLDAEHVGVINGGSIILLQAVVSRTVKNWPPLPTIAAGMAIAGLGYLCFAASRNPWVFVIGVAVASIGEMTSHPKYFSVIGLTAPSDKVALYMGYAFLYGVVGSLIGSNVGGLLYDKAVKPFLGTAVADHRATLFWLLFVAVDVAGAIALVGFVRRFSQDTAETRRRARSLMAAMYTVICSTGAVLLWWALSGPTPQYRTAVQASIFLVLGVGGLLMNRTNVSGPRPSSSVG